MLPSGHAGASPRSDFSFCEAQSLGAQDPVAGARGLRRCSSWAPEHRPGRGGAQSSWPTAGGIGPDQGSNPNLLRGQVDSLALRATREALISPISR